MEIFYKEREIDYLKTMAKLPVNGYVLIPTSGRDIASVRSQVAKASKKLDGRKFRVNKTINGARILRVEDSEEV